MHKDFLVELSITNECNLKCSYCYASVGNVLPEVMSKERFIEIVDTLKTDLPEDSIGILALSGGEPTIHPDILFFHTYLRMVFPKAPLYLTTNSIVLSKELLYSLVGVGLQSVAVSLPSMDRTITEQLNKTPGSFNKIVAGLERCLEVSRKTSLKVSANITLNNLNKGVFLDTIRYLALLGVPSIATNIVCPVGNGQTKENSIDIKEASELLLEAYGVAADIGVQFVNRTSYNFCVYDPRPKGLNHYRCIVGRFFLPINVKGELMICPHASNSLGTIRGEGSLVKLWESKGMHEARYNKNLPEECSGCSELEECGGPCKAEPQPKNLVKQVK